MLDIHVKFFERTGIEQDVEPLARRKPALGVLGIDALGATTGPRCIPPAFEVFESLEHYHPRLVSVCLAVTQQR